MSEHNTPQVSVKSGPSIVWLIPLITLLVGAWLMLQTILDDPPTATISFSTAEGIEAGKTKIKYKSVEIGIVEEIQFAEDFDHVVLNVVFNEGMEDFLRRNTNFWVVRPQLSFRGVSGLDTLISGSYIEIDPGPGAKQEHFVGLEKIPLITTDDAGTKITLVSEQLGSLGAGSPVYYRGLLAGEVLGYELGSDAQSIFIHAFIRDPFNQFVKGNSRFWNVSGLDVSLDANGIKVKTASMQSLMLGGLAFETPATLEQSKTAVENLIYTLYPNHDLVAEQAYTRKQKFVLYFSSSVRGLSPGAPLEFKGIMIGTVLDIKLEFDSDKSSFRIPILVEIEPERIVDRTAVGQSNPMDVLQTLVDRGLRARLSTGSLLTGKLFVELNMYPGTEAKYLGDVDTPYPELPTIPGAFEAMTESIQALVAKIETVDVEKMGDDIVGILGGTNDLLNKDQSEGTVTDLQGSMRSFRGILNQLEDAGVEDTLKSANGLLENLQTTISRLNTVLDPDSPLQYNVIRVTGELEETAKAVRTIIEMLERQPQSLIFGRDNIDSDGGESEK
ncbi:MAG: paraquat-inducible protein B [Candidatus Azotimanducaceae bacterium]